MARSIWTGVISFGLVSVPVRLFSATEEHEVSFHQFQKDTEDRIRYKRVNERTGKEIDFADIVKGAEIGNDKYVMLDPDELESVAPGRSKSLEIQAFVDLDDIDPIYYQKTYYLGPSDEETAKVYALLRDAMQSTNRAGIATFVMRGKEYLAAIRPQNDLLMLETMFFADEVRDPHQELDNLPGKVSHKGNELKMAEQLIRSMTDEWEPKDYRDTYTERVNDLIEAKRKDEEIVAADEAPEATNVVDLVTALRRSVEAARKSRAAAGSSSSKSSSSRKSTAKKSTATKSTAKKAAAKKAAAKKTARKKTAAKKSTGRSTAKKAS